MCSRCVVVWPVQGPPELVGAAFYRFWRVQQFDHMFGIRTHYRLCFEQVIDYSRLEERT